MQTETSIFDWRYPDNYKQWKSPSDCLNQNINHPILQTLAFSFIPSSPIFSDRYFLVTSECIFLKKKARSKKIRSCLTLKWSKVRFIKFEEADRSGGKYEFEMRVSRNGKFCRIFIENRKKLELWRGALTPMCAMTDFSDRYQFKQELKEIRYGKVNFFYIFS